MDLSQRIVPEREADLIVESRLNTLDRAKCLARVGTLVVAVLDDQAAGLRAANVVDGVVQWLDHRLLLAWHAYGLSIANISVKTSRSVAAREVFNNLHVRCPRGEEAPSETGPAHLPARAAGLRAARRPGAPPPRHARTARSDPHVGRRPLAARSRARPVVERSARRAFGMRPFERHL